MDKSKPEIIPVEKSGDPMGIELGDKQVKIRVPITFNECDDDKHNKNDLLLFLKSLSLSKTHDKEKNNKNTNELQQDSWPIDSYMWIIRDYTENGFYFNREKKYSNNWNGKIDWRRTMKKTPIISNGNIIYNDIVSSHMAATNDIIAQIYKICLSISLDRMGWFFGLSSNIDIQQELSKTEMLCRLRDEYNSTFDDVKRLRYKHMLNILEQVKTENVKTNNVIKNEINNYYYVFERMINKFFDGIDDSKMYKFNPHGQWHMVKSLNDPQYEFLSSALRPDTIHFENEFTYILDSKMYKYGGLANEPDSDEELAEKLPSTSSIQKQITYGKFVQQNKENHNKPVRNAFIMPFNKNLDRFKGTKKPKYVKFLDNDHNLAYIGYATGDWETLDQDCDYRYIFTFLIDFNFLLENYNNRDNSKYIDLLIKEIKTQLKDIKSQLGNTSLEN